MELGKAGFKVLDVGTRYLGLHFLLDQEHIAEFRCELVLSLDRGKDLLSGWEVAGGESERDVVEIGFVGAGSPHLLDRFLNAGECFFGSRGVEPDRREVQAI